MTHNFHTASHKNLDGLANQARNFLLCICNVQREIKYSITVFAKLTASFKPAFLYEVLTPFGCSGIGIWGGGEVTYV